MCNTAAAWALQQRGLRPVEWRVLWNLADLAPAPNTAFRAPQKILATRCEIDRSTLAIAVDALVRKGKLRASGRTHKLYLIEIPEQSQENES